MAVRIPINLSSEPFQRNRAMLVASVVTALLLVVALAVQTTLLLSERTKAAETREALAQAQLASLQQRQEQTRLDGILREDRNSVVIDRNIFLNTLISRKAVSWTQLFADLEKVMPGTVRLVSVRPQITPQNQVVLDMTVGSLTSEPVIDMMMRLEGSPLFGATTISSWLPPSQNEPLYRYRLSVSYSQVINPAATAEPKEVLRASKP
jgi:Tfp pilus assembly protein PilN